MRGTIKWHSLTYAGILLLASTVARAAVPTAPSNLVATAASASQINLTWTDRSSNELAFYIERKTGSGSFTGVGRVDANVTTFSDTGLTSATAYTYRVQAANASGFSAYTNQASATTPGPDVTPPSAPTALNATTVSATQVNLTWHASTDNVGVVTYQVYRTGRTWPTGCTATATQLGSPTVTSFSDTGITPNTPYCYFVSAVDAAGNVSVNSSLVAAPIDATAPTAPGGLTATVASSSQINLTWTASTDNWAVQAYVVLRDGVVLAYPTGTSFSDSGLTAATTYSYFVYAIDTSGNESLAHSNTVSATTLAGDTVPPTAPAGLNATAAGTTQINLSWTASTDNVGVTGYLLERCQGAGCSNFAQIATSTATTLSDTGLTPAISYSYRVRATDAAGNLSAYSNVASASTSSPQAQMYFIHPDHLNTPRMIANQAGATVWRNDNTEPFGDSVPNGDPGNTGVAFDFPLRFQGQYFDRETGLAYNGMRDYDPRTGRYIQSDPIGLKGGLNSYLYVYAVPVRLIDPFGLEPCYLKSKYGEPYQIEEDGDLQEERNRIPGVDNKHLADCLGAPGPHALPRSLEVAVCILTSLDPHGSPATIVWTWRDIYLATKMKVTVEEWCEVACPPKYVLTYTFSFDWTLAKKYLRTDRYRPYLVPSDSGDPDPNPFLQ
jgi:RHS repeat-associated protein